jgi:hypothetical protein
MTSNGHPDGFSIIEVLVAIMILSFGILSMGASTGYIMNEINSSRLRSERMGAVRQAAETLRATPWTELDMACGQAMDIADYSISCAVTRPVPTLARVQLTSVGPGYLKGKLDLELSETFALSLSQPVQ